MATRKEILARAKEIIESYPNAGKGRVNSILRIEFGVGLRNDAILRIKNEVAQERPQLAYALYERGGVPRRYQEVYNAWKSAGFLPFEARELTLGHGERYMNFNALAVYNSEPARAAREFRIKLINDQLRAGWTKKQIRDNIIDFYRKSQKVDPWGHIRAEYKPRKRIDFVDYREQVRRREKDKQRRLLKRKKP